MWTRVSRAAAMVSQLEAMFLQKACAGKHTFWFPSPTQRPLQVTLSPPPTSLCLAQVWIEKFPVGFFLVPCIIFTEHAVGGKV